MRCITLSFVGRGGRDITAGVSGGGDEAASRDCDFEVFFLTLFALLKAFRKYSRGVRRRRTLGVPDFLRFLDKGSESSESDSSRGGILVADEDACTAFKT
jgi:hypothetical protein